MPRREDARLLAGQGRFVANLVPPGCLHLAFLRSPYRAGRIALLDTADARDLPGVRAVLTAGDLVWQATAAVNPLLPEARMVPLVPLARGFVRAAGQAVAAVVADTPEAARDAVDAILFEVEEDPESPEPVARERVGAADALPPGGQRIVARVDHALVAPMAMEPRAALAVPDDAGLTVWLPVQTPQRCRDDLAAMLGLPPDRVRVVAPDVGGAFGGKASLMPEDAVVAAAALRLGRGVFWQGTRSEDFVAATQGRGARTRAEAVLEGGRITALRATMTFPLGHWMPYSALAPARNGARILPGPYLIEDCGAEVTALTTEGPAVNIYRGAGRPEAAMLLERLMDRAAEADGTDPLEMRRRHVSGAGPRACSGDMGALLDRMAVAADYAGLRLRQAARRAAGAVCGIGIGLYVEPCGQGWETAGIDLLPDGTVRARSGSSAQGQGRETAAAQIVAERLGIDPGRIAVAAGDTAVMPEGIGALASRSTAIGGAALLRAADRFLMELREAAAAMLGVDPAAVSVTDAGVSTGAATLSWGDVAARLGRPLSVDLRHETGAEAWASGAVLAEVGIDPDTGAVTVERITWADDAGRVVNPVLVRGQLLGGLAQGLGAALMERMVIRDGQCLTGSLMDYAVPRAADMPPVTLLSCPTPSPANPLGAKGVGEAGCIGVPAAILNAVQDALIPHGAPDLSLPLTPEKVWRAINRLPQEAP
ncbi:MAG: xanthine dehydrogenase family protein molybdopterin-binding subunit [Paracoccaceae bacterium]|nr:MAG: xanthine dehydrogenase family protein molybdopterin-binding subunit [Paracoccaceae bacterium]